MLAEMRIQCLGVIDDALFSAVVIMVMVTTMMTPIALKWSLGRSPVSFETLGDTPK